LIPKARTVIVIGRKILTFRSKSPEARGAVEIKDYWYLFGHTKIEHAWFGPLLQALEIEFAVPPRKRQQ
jgi:hypothetical protein